MAMTTITESPSPTSRRASLIDGRCYWSNCEGWKCSRKGFACEGGVCVDRLTPEQKEADKHDAADGKKGRCKYSYDAQSYYCTQRRFACVDETVCANHRTAEAKAENEVLSTEKKRKAKRTAAIVGGVFGGVIEVVLVTGIVMRICGLWKKGKPEREQAKSGMRRGIKTSKIEMKEGK